MPILRLPGALQSEIASGDEDLAALAASVREQIGPLLEELKAMRAREGEALEAILTARWTGWPRPPKAWRRCVRRSNSAIRSG